MKKILALSWIIVLLALFYLQSQFKGESTVFGGITDDSGQTISFKYPVEIIDLKVVQGEKVKKGIVLLKVRRSNLASEQVILKEKMHELSASNSVSVASIKAEIQSLQARKSAEQADIDSQIHRLQAQYQDRRIEFQTNQKILADITGSRKSAKRFANPYQKQINALRKQRVHIGRSIQAQINNLRKQQKGNRPIYAQISALKERRSELNRQVKELVVKADLEGRVGTVVYKKGETVEAFKPVLSIHALYPELVKGYIHENVYNKVQAGQQVWVTSLALNGEAIPQTGIVENVGNRIVEYPQRLKKNVLLPAFGREVLIRLDEKENGMLLGEKVNVGLAPPEPSMIEKNIAQALEWITVYAEEKAYVFNQ